MVRECRHIMPAGLHCKSPAMRRSVYCYHHDRLHRYRGRPGPRKSIQLPKLDTREALIKGLTDVMNAILHDKIDPRKGGRLIHGMQIASEHLGKAPAPSSAKGCPLKRRLMEIEMSKTAMQAAAPLNPAGCRTIKVEEPHEAFVPHPPGS